MQPQLPSSVAEISEYDLPVFDPYRAPFTHAVCPTRPRRVFLRSEHLPTGGRETAAATLLGLGGGARFHEDNIRVRVFAHHRSVFATRFLVVEGLGSGLASSDSDSKPLALPRPERPQRLFDVAAPLALFAADFDLRRKQQLAGQRMQPRSAHRS